METSLSTVTKYSDSVLAKKFLDDVPTVDKVYNLDCDPTAFKIILTWLRYLRFSELPLDTFILKVYF